MPVHPLIRLMLAHAGGKDVEPHRPVPPPYLCDRDWRYVCACGYSWSWHGDAVRRNDAWLPPRRQCLQCHVWIDGHDR